MPRASGGVRAVLRGGEAGKNDFGRVKNDFGRVRDVVVLCRHAVVVRRVRVREAPRGDLTTGLAALAALVDEGRAVRAGRLVPAAAAAADKCEHQKESEQRGGQDQ
jgi:hypothetical protein